MTPSPDYRHDPSYWSAGQLAARNRQVPLAVMWQPARESGLRWFFRVIVGPAVGTVALLFIVGLVLAGRVG